MMNRLIRTRPMLRKLAQYFVTAGVAAIVDIGGFALLLGVGAALVPAAMASFLAANVVNYVLTSSYVFKTAPSLRRYPVFLAAAAAGFVVNVAVTALSAHLLHLAPVLAKTTGVGIAFFANFALNAVFVFPTRPDETTGGPDRGDVGRD